MKLLILSTRYHFSRAISLALLLSASLCAAWAADFDKKDIAAHLLARLQDIDAPRFADRKLAADDVASAQQVVWAAFADACAEYDFDCLPMPDSLAAARQYAWQLPDGSEPSTNMPFYFGTKGSKPDAGYPLFLYMHGSGEKSREWSVGLGWCKYFNDSPSLYFIPQIPNMGRYYRWWHRSKQVVWQRLLRQAFISGIVDPNRIYFFGISEGAYGSQRMASFYADYLAGAGPIAGGEPLINAPVENLANIAFTLTSGENDTQFCRHIYTDITRQALDSMQTIHPSQYKHNVFLQPGRDHHCDYTYTTPWLAKHMRNPYPKHFIWEDFPMDTVYRRGFYNLQVIERPEITTDSTRTVYEYTAADNVIDIKVHNVRYFGYDFVPMWELILHFGKEIRPTAAGKIRIYLNDQIADLNRPVTIKINGKKVFRGKVKRRLSNIVESCAIYQDPTRLFPASVTVKIPAQKH